MGNKLVYIYRMHVLIKKALSLVGIFSFLGVSAQHFEWASSGSHIFAGYSKSCMTADGRLVAAGEYDQPTSYISGSGIPTLHSGTGEDFSFDNYSSQVFVTGFGMQGQIEWVFGTNSLTRDAYLKGIAPDQLGNVILAFQPKSYIDFSFEMKEDGNWKTYDQSAYNIENGKWNSAQMTFFALIGKNGKLKKVFGSADFPRESWNDFLATPDGGFVVAYSDELKSVNSKGVHIQTGYHFTIKLNPDFTKAWEHKAKILAPTCCSYFMPSSLVAVSPDGDVFLAANYHFGIALDGSKEHQIVPFYETGQYKDPHDAYVARLGANGKLKWVKYLDGKSIIKSIHVAGNQVVFGGVMMLQRDFLGINIDTTEAKKSFLATLSFEGKPNWIKTFNAAGVESITSDVSGGIFASFENKRSRGMIPLKIGADTIPNSYDGVVVAAFEPNGDYKWFKSSRAMLTRNTRPNLLSDACGNLYFVGEMWFMLSANMNIFDAALVKGRGYGGAPLAAKIRTTIPDELLAMNKGLSVKIPIKPKEPKEKVPESPVAHSNPERTPPIDSVQTSRAQPVCMAIPFPWKLTLFPNPSAGPITIRVETSYADNKVSLELWDGKGAFIKRIKEPGFQEAGTFELTEDFSSLAKGLYFVVLKGSSSAASERMILVN